jgi:DNA-binding NarL/FixJ family response regulator
MARTILLIEDQPDVRGLLRSALSTLRGPDIETFEAASGDQAVQEFARRRIDLLVLKNQLPDIPAIELMHGLRAGRPDLRVIVITEARDRGKRDEILNAGAAAVFEKPVPLGDFLDAVEKSLGVTPTIFPPDGRSGTAARLPRSSDLLANLRQDIHAGGVLLINQRGLVAARAGGLQDSSMEVTVISGLAAIFSAGLKVARTQRQKALRQHACFQGEGEDLILMPVDERYALLLAGRDLASPQRRERSLDAMRAVCTQLEKSLGEAEVMEEAATPPEAVIPEPKARDTKLDDLLDDARRQAAKTKDLDSFWEQAAAQSTEAPSDPDAISYEEARKLGLTPDRNQE